MGYKNMCSSKFSCSRPKQHYHNSYIYHDSCHIIPGSLAAALPISNAYFSLFCQCMCKASGKFPLLISLHMLPESSQDDPSYLLQIPSQDTYSVIPARNKTPHNSWGKLGKQRSPRHHFEKFDASRRSIHTWVYWKCPNNFLHVFAVSWPFLMKKNKQRNPYR